MLRGFVALAAILVVSCGGQEQPPPAPIPTAAPVPTVAAVIPTPTAAPIPTEASVPPTPTPAPVPTEAAAPQPTPTPESTERVAEIASEWAANNAEAVAELVVEAVLASPDVEERVPALLRVSFGGLLEGVVADELGNSLGVAVNSLAYHGDAIYSVTLLVSGTVVVELGPVEAVDVAVPVIVTVDVDNERATSWEADTEQAEVTIR